jgi:hypothetical protein
LFTLRVSSVTFSGAFTAPNLLRYSVNGGTGVAVGRGGVIAYSAGVAQIDSERGRFGDAVRGAGPFVPLRRCLDTDDGGFVLEHVPDGAGVDTPEF